MAVDIYSLPKYIFQFRSQTNLGPTVFESIDKVIKKLISEHNGNFIEEEKGC